MTHPVQQFVICLPSFGAYLLYWIQCLVWNWTRVIDALFIQTIEFIFRMNSCQKSVRDMTIIPWLLTKLIFFWCMCVRCNVSPQKCNKVNCASLSAIVELRWSMNLRSGVKSHIIALKYKKIMYRSQVTIMISMIKHTIHSIL